MKKKELKQRIRELESECSREKDIIDCYKDTMRRLIEGLKSYGVKAEIIFDRPTIEYVNEDGTMGYMAGISTAPPEIKFDFSEHDRKAPADKSASNESKEEREIKNFREKEDKYYIYIKDFLAEPMKYKILGLEGAHDEIPMAHIRFENGVADERNIKELMSCYTLEDCTKQCEQLNEQMKEHRKLWFGDSWRLNQLIGDGK